MMSGLKDNFDKKGYIALESFLEAEEIAEAQRQTARFIENVVPGLPSDIVYYENKADPSTLKQVQKLYEHDEYFLHLASSAKVVGLAETLLGGKVILQNMQYFNKVPRIGRGTPAHQDGFYFMIQPQEAITMWLSLGDADAANGAVCYVPGSHRTGMRPHGRTSTLGFSQAISDWSSEDDQAEIQMEARAGDMLVHHSLTIHRANNNSSDRDRKSLGFIFYRADVTVDKEAHAAYSKRLHESLNEQGKI